MVEFKLNWGQHLRDLIAHAGPACTVVDKFGENHQVNNGKLVGIPTPDRFPLTVSVERAVLQASGGSEKLPLSDVTSDVPSPTSVATINTPSPKGQPINSFHRISKILWTDAGSMKFLVHPYLCCRFDTSLGHSPESIPRGLQSFKKTTDSCVSQSKPHSLVQFSALARLNQRALLRRKP